MCAESCAGPLAGSCSDAHAMVGRYDQCSDSTTQQSQCHWGLPRAPVLPPGLNGGNGLFGSGFWGSAAYRLSHIGDWRVTERQRPLL